MKKLDSPCSTAEPNSPEYARHRQRLRTVRLSLIRRTFVALIITSGILLTPLTSRWPVADPFMRDVMIMLGMLLIGTGAALRLWAGLYLGGHKERQLVTCGPYSCVRNPLYLGNIVAAAGIGLISGSPYVLTLTLTATTLVYLATIRQEEHKLQPLFGSDYNRYLQAAPPLLPHPAAVRRLIKDTTPCTITHFSLARELRRCLCLVALGFVAFLLAMAAPLLHAHLPTLL